MRKTVKADVVTVEPSEGCNTRNRELYADLVREWINLSRFLPLISNRRTTLVGGNRDMSHQLCEIVQVALYVHTCHCSQLIGKLDQFCEIYLDLNVRIVSDPEDSVRIMAI